MQAMYNTQWAANTFSNKERVYSRAIAFSNRRCSVLLESTLPNISAMYIHNTQWGGGVEAGHNNTFAEVTACCTVDASESVLRPGTWSAAVPQSSDALL